MKYVGSYSRIIFIIIYNYRYMIICRLCVVGVCRIISIYLLFRAEFINSNRRTCVNKCNTLYDIKAPKYMINKCRVIFNLSNKFWTVPLYSGLLQRDSTRSTTATMVKLRPGFAFTNDNPYLALTGELWGVFREIFKGKWLRYIGSALYI